MTWKLHDIAIESYSFHHQDPVRLQLRTRYYFPFLFSAVAWEHAAQPEGSGVACATIVLLTSATVILLSRQQRRRRPRHLRHHRRLQTRPLCHHVYSHHGHLK
jgi:hypothetical protein